MQGLEIAIDSESTAKFENAYRQTMAGCYSCHVTCEKPYLRLRIPETKNSTVINFAPH
jgi:hypothetical protein